MLSILTGSVDPLVHYKHIRAQNIIFFGHFAKRSLRYNKIPFLVFEGLSLVKKFLVDCEFA